MANKKESLRNPHKAKELERLAREYMEVCGRSNGRKRARQCSVEVCKLTGLRGGSALLALISHRGMTGQEALDYAERQAWK